MRVAMSGELEAEEMRVAISGEIEAEENEE
jgi:hypothetical protein